MSAMADAGVLAECRGGDPQSRKRSPTTSRARLPDLGQKAGRGTVCGRGRDERGAGWAEKFSFVIPVKRSGEGSCRPTDLERLAQREALHPIHLAARTVAQRPTGEAAAAPLLAVPSGHATKRFEILEDLLADLKVEGVFGRLVEVVGRFDKFGPEGVLEVIRVLGDDVKALWDTAVPTPEVPVCRWMEARRVC